MSDSEQETLTLQVSSEEVALEIGYALHGRAIQIHQNPDDEFEHIAEELAELAKEVRDEYE